MTLSPLQWAKLFEILKNGLQIDEAWVDGTKTKVTQGEYKLNVGSGTDITAQCTFTHQGAPHTLEGVYAKGANNNSLTIDGTPQKLVRIARRIDVDSTFGQPLTIELETKWVYKQGENEKIIILSSEKIPILALV